MKFVIKTLGCKANLADSRVLAGELERRGWKEAGQGELPHLCIVNSCTVTDEADRQSRKLASRLSRLNPDARVVVTGCAAEVDPERIAASQGIDYVVGNGDKPRLVELILSRLDRPRAKGEILGSVKNYAEIASRHPLDREWAEPSGWAGEGMTRAFLKIQEGCNAFCTYCIIPYGRGPSRSLRPIEVVSAVRQVCARGVREVVLTGTNLGDYGTDLSDGGAPMFEDLLRAILSETPLERLRLSSLDPTEITPGILALMKSEPRLCPHFHVSLQSPRDRVLKLMKRKYGEKESRECLERIAELGAFVGMDLIAGFPGETEEEFVASVKALESWPWARLHVFPYSEREGTPATRLPNAVSPAKRAERAKILRELSLSRMKQVYERKLAELSGGRFEGILLERAHDGFVHGYTPGYLRVRMPEKENARGSVVSAIPSGIALDAAAGEVFFEVR